MKELNGKIQLNKRIQKNVLIKISAEKLAKYKAAQDRLDVSIKFILHV